VPRAYLIHLVKHKGHQGHLPIKTQRALLPIAVGAMNINEFMNINGVRESATILPKPLHVDL